MEIHTDDLLRQIFIEIFLIFPNLKFEKRIKYIKLTLTELLPNRWAAWRYECSYRMGRNVWIHWQFRSCLFGVSKYSHNGNEKQIVYTVVLSVL